MTFLPSATDPDPAPPTTRPSPGLPSARRDTFRQSGYLVLPGFLPGGDFLERLRLEIDCWVEGGLRARSIACCLDEALAGPPPMMELELPAHGELLALPALMQIVFELVGAPFVVHHQDSDRQVPGAAGRPWHHDYEANSRPDADLTMLQTLHYVEGLDESVGSLVLLPGSHRERVPKTARAHLGTDRLPGEVVIDRLPPGSTVLLHSALFHARRPAAVRGRSRSRYLVDASYCQTGARWRPSVPYWRYMLRRGRELQLDDGRWPELFEEQHFTEFTRV